MRSCNIVIAMWWKTSLKLRHFNALRHAYFVQSIESRFYPATVVPLRVLVDATYRLPGTYVTEAAWIRNHLAAVHGHEVVLVRNGIRKDVYRTTGPIMAPRDRQPHMLVEGHLGVSFKNTALGIRLAREAAGEVLFGSREVR